MRRGLDSMSGASVVKTRIALPPVESAAEIGLHPPLLLFHGGAEFGPALSHGGGAGAGMPRTCADGSC